MPTFDLPDPEKGRKTFEWLYGPGKGERRFRRLLLILVPLAAIAAILVLAAQITNSGSAIYSTVAGWFSRPSIAVAQVQPAPPPPPAETRANQADRPEFLFYAVKIPMVSLETQ